MTEEQFNKIEELIKNHSTQVEDKKYEDREHIKEVIIKTVNGKIDGFRKEFASYVEEDILWKEKAQPAVDFFRNVTWAKSFILGVLLFIGSAISVAVAAKNLFK
jgi:hypothetical protein